MHREGRLFPEGYRKMKLKAVSGIMLTLLLIGMLTLVFDIQTVKAEAVTAISVEPAEYTASRGESFTIDITITNVSRLGDFQFRLDYNTTILDATSCALTLISEQYLLLPFPWTPTYGIRDDLGFVVFGGVIIDLDSPFSGSGSLLKINFIVAEIGSTTLHLTTQALDYITPYPDWDIGPIEHTVMNGSVTVIQAPPPPVGGKATPINIPMNKPETPTLWIWLTTIILSLAVTAVYVKKRKRNSENIS